MDTVTGMRETKKNMGAVGILTKGQVSREKAFRIIVMYAMAKYLSPKTYCLERSPISATFAQEQVPSEVSSVERADPAVVQFPLPSFAAAASLPSLPSSEIAGIEEDRTEPDDQSMPIQLLLPLPQAPKHQIPIYMKLPEKEDGSQ